MKEKIRYINIAGSRDVTIDIMKGIGIIMMVLGHSGFLYSSYFTTFHMALFFIVSGYLFNNECSKNIKNVKSYILKKLKSLWLPYFIGNSIFIVLNNFFLSINIYTSNPLIESIGGMNIAKVTVKMGFSDIIINIVKSFFFLGGTTLGGTFWFLRVLFAALVMTCIFEFIIRKIFKWSERMRREGVENNSGKIFATQIVLAVILLIAGYVLTKNNINMWNIPHIFTTYFFIIAGRVIKKFKGLLEVKMSQYRNSEKSEIKFWDKIGEKSVAINIILIVFLAFILFVMEKKVVVNLADNFYSSITGMIIASFAGFFFVYLVSDLLKNTFLSKCLVKCGQNTLPVMILHFLCFKIVNCIQVIIYHYESYKIAAFPILDGSGMWWLFYAVCGICIPIILNEIRKCLILHYH